MKNVILTDEEVERLVASAQHGPDLSDEIEPRAVNAWYDCERGLVMLQLKNGCVFGFPPPAAAYWGLQGATREQLAAVEAWDYGEALHWEEIDADISVPGLLLHLLNVKAWYAKWLGGAKRTEVKIAKEPSVKSIEIDPGRDFPDVDRDNQRWPR